MTKKDCNYKIRTFPRTRRIASEAFDLAVKHHVVHGLHEFDATRILQFINDQKQKGKVYSFLGYFIFCLAQAIKEFEIINSMRYGNRKLIIFENIDISFLLETDDESIKMPVMYVIKAADKKNI